MRVCTVTVRRGTPSDLIAAAGLGARIAARYGRAQSLDDNTIRRSVIVRYRRILGREDHDDYEGETLMAAVQRSVDEVLAGPGARPVPDATPWIEREGGRP